MDSRRLAPNFFTIYPIFDALLLSCRLEIPIKTRIRAYTDMAASTSFDEPSVESFLCSLLLRHLLRDFSIFQQEATPKPHTGHDVRGVTSFVNLRSGGIQKGATGELCHL